MSKYGRISARVDLDAIRKNLYAMREKLKPETKIVAVVKTDGYGHGACAIGRYLEQEDCLWGYAVATAEEALELKVSGLQKPVLILGYVFPEDYKMLIRQEIRPAVYTSEFAIAYGEAADAQGLKAPYHLAINSGMNRIGVRFNNVVEFLSQVSFHRALELEGCFTHFATADALETLDFQIQINHFVEAMRAVR